MANSPPTSSSFKDTDGDGKADKTEVVVTGFGRDDTHELPNSLTWGPDGWLYGWNGVFNPAHVEHRGKTFDFTCAIFRIHPRTRDFEVWCEGTSNPWGIAFDDEGSLFASACVIDHLWHLVETGYYHRQGGPYPPDTWKIESIVDHKHQKAAYCGITLFDSPAYPPQFREMLVMGNIHGNCINSDRLERRGSTYACKGQSPISWSPTTPGSCPSSRRPARTGRSTSSTGTTAITATRTPTATRPAVDRLKGRLYRVRYGETPRRSGFDLSKSTDERADLRSLGSANVYDRDIAQRLLDRNGRAPPPSRSSRALIFGRIEPPRKARLHGLMGSDRFRNRSPDDFFLKLLNSPDPTFRAWGVRAAGNKHKVGPAIREKLASMAKDPGRDVALQVAIAARKVEGIDAEAVLADVLLACGDDRLIPHIVWQNVHPLLGDKGETFLKKVASAHLEGEAAGIKGRMIDRVLGRRDADPGTVVALIEVLADGRDRDDSALRKALESLASKVQSGELAGPRLTTLRERLTPVLAHLKDRTGPIAVDLALLGASWNDPSGLERARLFAIDGSASVRLRAIAALIAAGDPSGLDASGRALASSMPADFRGNVLAALGRLDDPKVAAVVLAAYPKMEPDLKPRAVELLTDRPAWASSLLDAIGRGEVAKGALNVNQVRKLLASKDESLARKVKATWGTLREGRNPAREQVVSRMKSTLRHSPGDPNAGRLAFNKVCAQCHKIYGEGQDVGPDLTSNGRNDWDQLLSNVFDPSLVIGSAYQAVTVATSDGRVLNGLLAEDGKDRVVLKGQGGKVDTIPRADVEAMKTSDVSLMPEDLENQLSPREIADLFAFLALDKPPSDPSARRLAGSYSPPKSVPNAEMIDRVAPGFTTEGVGEGGLDLLTFLGKSPVLRTHPVSQDEPCTLYRRLEIPADRPTRLILDVANDPQGDWRLLIKADGRVLHDSIVKSGWTHVEADLTAFAGRSVLLELENRANGWNWEFGYWGKVEVESKPK